MTDHAFDPLIGGFAAGDPESQVIPPGSGGAPGQEPIVLGNLAHKNI